MDEGKSRREILHELGNVQQEKVALQYQLVLAAELIEELAADLADESARERALKSAERFRRLAEL